MTKCRGELVSKESELQRLRRDVASKASQIIRLEESLQHMKSQLDSKTDMCMSHSFCSFTYFLQRRENLRYYHIHITGSLSLLTLFVFRLPSGGSGGGAPSLWGRQAELCPAGPDPGGAATGGASRDGWHSGATTGTQRCSAENPNHRRWAASLSGKTDWPT